MALIAILAIPLLAALLCWVRPLRRVAWGITVASTWTAFALAVYVSAEVIASKAGWSAVPGWFEADGLSCADAGPCQLRLRPGVRFRGRLHAARRAPGKPAVVVLLQLQSVGLRAAGGSFSGGTKPGVGGGGAGYAFRRSAGRFRQHLGRAGGRLEVCGSHHHGRADLAVRILRAVLGVPFRDRRRLGDLGRSAHGRTCHGSESTEAFLSPGVCRIRG